ncbi:MAG: nucleotidyl transferase [Planctomycetota bacterium]|nr:MAG: nucleotidyl transferase [Planctomycetota bacterium]
MAKEILVLSSKTSFEEAVKLLDINGNGILPVVDENKLLLGIITDGDIRKAILEKHLDLDHVINKNPFKLSISSSYRQRIQFLKKIKRRQLPLVDDENHYLDMFTLDDSDFEIKENWVVIMAGGLGTRLGDLTKDTPKPMLKVGGKPILERIIEKFIEQGFSKFFISVNFKKEVIKDYFKNGDELNVEIKYLEEAKRLGTAGALSLIDVELKNPLLIINGDVLSVINFTDFLNFHKSTESVATMCVKEYEYVVPYGVVETEGTTITGLTEKPKVLFSVNSGVYALNPSVLSYVPEGSFYDMPSLFKDLIDKKINTNVYRLDDYWIDIGKLEDLKKANNS